ncbi:MAG: RND transporter [endosymbiont of Seepiophila jonesi]|uniref:RND transporter n=1 Tax=endosymbiont of Lamellibrachia luymesi TaxID=2200907 RepID=A0A370DJW5_9GAMM|nr:MAG: RND transporter [endosymbiont of Lamellibrachia luymesi]RDH90537.1 MAG: RND transporter [endosymbiont of Seepiophila jonesi]
MSKRTVVIGSFVTFCLLLLSGCGHQLEVVAVTPVRGGISSVFTEPAQTRLARTYRVTMPVDGRIGHVDLLPGDRVEAGQPLAMIDRFPFEQRVEEAQAAVSEMEQQLRINAYDEIEKTLAIEMTATVEATRDALRAADAQVDAEKVRVAWAEKVRERNTQLAKEGSVSQQDLENAVLAAQTAQISLKQEEFIQAALNTLFTAIKLGPKYVEQWLGRKRLEREVSLQQLAQARTRLARAEYQLDLAQLRAPVSGVVLHRYSEGEGSLPAGQLLLEIGNPADLEVVSDVLTRDAMRLSVGTSVGLTAGDMRLQGIVKRIEPAGFTKRSSLGVEQQRVNVVVALSEHPDKIGVGYRLQARFHTGSSQNTLILPRFSVLQAADGSHYVFLIEGNRLKRRVVKLGLRNDRQLEIVDGLSEGERVVSVPDAEMKDGQSVRVAAEE